MGGAGGGSTTVTQHETHDLHVHCIKCYLFKGGIPEIVIISTGYILQTEVSADGDARVS